MVFGLTFSEMHAASLIRVTFGLVTGMALGFLTLLVAAL